MNHISSDSNYHSSKTEYLMLKIAFEKFNCSHKELKPDQVQDIKKQAIKLENINSLILLSKEAKEIVISDQILNDALENITKRYPSKADFDRDISNIGISISAYKRMLRNELIIDCVLERVTKDIAVKSEEVKKFYENNVDLFNVPEKRTVRHILITINDQIEGNSRTDSELAINLIYDELSRDKSKFEYFAQRRSECPTSINGGLIGAVCKGVLFPELDEELFSMAEDSISRAVETDMGFHILYCGNIEQKKVMPFSEVEEKIEEQLLQKKKSQLQKRWIKSIISNNQKIDQVKVKEEMEAYKH